MKKLIFLLFPIFALAQNPTSFPYGIKNTAAASNSTPTYFVTQETDGVHKKTPAALYAKTSTVNYFSPSTLKWAGLGDSITYGVGSTTGNTSYFDIISSSYSFLRTDKLGYSGAVVKPISGRTSLSYIISQIPSDANLITVMIGVNDWDNDNPIGNVYEVLKKTHSSLDENNSFAEAFRWNLENIKYSFPNAKIIIITPTRTKGSWQGLYDLKYYVDAEISIANFLSIPVINAFDNSGIYYNDTTYLNDGLHPNDAGYQLISKKVLAGIITNPENRNSDTLFDATIVDNFKVGGTSSTGSDGSVVFKGFTGVTHGRMEIYPYNETVTPNVIIRANGGGTGGGFSYFDAGNYGFGTKTDNGTDRLQVAGSGLFSGSDSSTNGVLSIVTGGGIDLRIGGNSTYSWIQSFNSKPLRINDLGNDVIINSATLTGTPTAPTATAGTNTTQIATTAFVQSAVGSNVTQTITNGVTTTSPSEDAVFDALALKASLSGEQTFTGQVNAGSFVTGGSFITGSTYEGLKAPNNGPISFVCNHPSTPGWTADTNITATFYKTTVYTVATLPTTGVSSGTYATVSDALAPAYLTTVVGGGAIVTPVFYNGSNWVCH